MWKLTKTQKLSITFAAIAVEGAGCLIALLLIPADVTSAFAFGFSLPRLLIAAAILAGVVVAAYLAWWSRLRKNAGRVEALISSKAAFYFLLAASFAGAAFCLNWRFARPELLAGLQRVFPLVLFATLAALQLFALGLLSKSKLRERSIALAALLVLLTAFYLSGAVHYSNINKKYWLSDQQSFMLFTRQAKESSFSYTGTRNYMPAYPYLQAVFLDTRLPDPQLYAQGKMVNIALSIVLLAGTFLVARKYLELDLAVLFTLLIAFTLSIYKAAYMQPEILYYFFAFSAFVMMLRLFARPAWYLALGTGIVLGLAHYTKASVLPALGLFVVCMLAKSGYEAFQNRTRQFAIRSAAAAVLVLLAFLGTVYPYIRESKQTYGTYFYNVASTFYVWYDDWSQVAPGTKAYGDSVGWPDMPADQVPSIQKYFREHSLGDIAARLAKGYGQQATNITVTFALVSFPLLFAAANVGVAAQQRARTAVILKEHFFLIGFAALYFVMYLSLYGWYGPLVDYSDQRFTYSLYAPLLFCAFYVLQLFASRPEKARSFTPPKWLPAFYTLVVILLAADLLLRVPLQLTAFHWFGK